MNKHKFLLGGGRDTYLSPSIEAFYLDVEQGFAISPTNPPKKDWTDEGGIDEEDRVDLGDF